MVYILLFLHSSHIAIIMVIFITINYAECYEENYWFIMNIWNISSLIGIIVINAIRKQNVLVLVVLFESEISKRGVVWISAIKWQKNPLRDFNINFKMLLIFRLFYFGEGEYIFFIANSLCQKCWLKLNKSCWFLFGFFSF